MSLYSDVKFLHREQLVSDLYQQHSDVILEFLAEEEISLSDQQSIVHSLNKLIWANNMSVREGKHLRLSNEGRYVFTVLSDRGHIAKVIQPFDRDLSKDHGLWLELSRKCPVPWYVYPMASRLSPKNSGPRVELWEFGPDTAMLSFMLAAGNLKSWLNLLKF